MGLNRFRRAVIGIVVAGLVFCAAPAERRDSPQTMSLDGVWEIAFDPDNVGRRAGWSDDAVFASFAGRRRIPVPICWELHEAG